ncbi:glycoside hydrolase family 3 C-terminal domain-containing protein [Bifidobacterium choloepi]|uniref:Fibronectin type III-like domain-containing protein n=1 Tax=Bifidobacterium choloepi TaxID=2614131 RepID=A0A6I5MYQ8_9BIFI|nr:glycoside hydrolase family 3 C-terminal domain-containing protein [Bifidobacterium choloepi]NEG69407.1 hypothetical protein [Bifidobacterium choloepi]
MTMTQPHYHGTELWNENLDIATRVEWLLGELTLDEKAVLIAADTPAIDRLGIRPYSMGHAGSPIAQPISMAATWDPALVQLAGTATGEHIRRGFHAGDVIRAADNGDGNAASPHDTTPLSGLTCDIAVSPAFDPRWEGVEYSFGEDPLLCGVMASVYIAGAQGTPISDNAGYRFDNVNTVAKFGDFSVDDPLRVCGALAAFFLGEGCGTPEDITVDARNRREYFLEPFRRGIITGNASAVETASSVVNGTPERFDPRLAELVHDSYGIHGHVVSDEHAVAQAVVDGRTPEEAVAAMLCSGVDAVRDDPAVVERAVHDALDRGLLAEADLDVAIGHTFATKIRLGLFDARPINPYQWKQGRPGTMDPVDPTATAERLEAEQLVLLKNNGLLPLPIDGHRTLGVVGPESFIAGVKKAVDQCAGAVVGSDIDVVGESDRSRAVDLALDVDTVAVVCRRAQPDVANPRTIAFPDDERRLLQDILQVNSRVIVVLLTERPVCIDWEKAAIPAILTTAALGSASEGRTSAAALERTGRTVGRALVGDVNPAGRLPMTWYGPGGSVGSGLVPAGIVRDRASEPRGVDGPLDDDGDLYYDKVPDEDDFDIIGTGRTYQWCRGPVLFPFGHGLSYTTFDVELAAPLNGGRRLDTTIDHSVLVNLRVTNTGARTGDDVLQVYVRYPRELGGGANEEVKPVRRLIGFERLNGLKPGENFRVQMRIPLENLRMYDVRKEGFRIPYGTYQLEVGSSSADIRLSLPMQVRGEKPATRPVHEWIAIDHWDEMSGAALVPSRPLMGQEPGRACAAVLEPGAAEARLTFRGFESTKEGRRLRVAGERRRTDDGRTPIHVEVGANVIVADGDGAFPLPPYTTALDIVLTGPAKISGLRVD